MGWCTTKIKNNCTDLLLLIYWDVAHSFFEFRSNQLDAELKLTKSNTFLSTDRDFWYEEARVALRRRLSSDGSTGSARPVARNVILFVGDGMGLATITASRILRGQREGHPGEETRLAWEHFPAVALARVSASFTLQ